MSNAGNSCCAEVTVLSAMGLHARPAAQIANMAAKSEAQLYLTVANDSTRRADASSVLEMLILAAVKGTVLKLEAEGPGSEELLNEIADFFKRGFDEN